ncbi:MULTISPECIES: response regulator [Microbacterium]|jgi:DNA-binding NarL/FixJ family response regulator|uniref:Response regulator transcription factor n=2 Tax=Microbacterium maritypicum TaxID=33918 RepID=A0ACD4B524_MICMQ|nr:MULTISPECIES: response regulator transcription factor [Microbacterium]AZS48452.1 Transcriptional regulatory protein DegU [Microbacterium oxydans]UTT52407.1 response regulator transcription factor [Microbacterium liquefaciens]WEF20439.1 response regulator transcription factor [Microbacterium liquefaciens]WKT89888.1 response regulator transcription factor [Microbacterium liquefaciens]
MQEIRVVIVDDDPLVRSALSHFVSRDPEITVVAQAEDGVEAIATVEREQPDVVMMDVQMPEMDGIEATGVIAERWPHVRVLAVTTLDGSDTVLPMLSAGASGYLLKDSSADDIVTGVREVHSGASSLSPRIASMLIKHVRDSTPVAADAAALEPLTEREVEVLHCLAQGMSNAEIAKALIVSEGTVKAHLGRMMSKWHLRDRVQILVTAAHAGLVSFR